MAPRLTVWESSVKAVRPVRNLRTHSHFSNIVLHRRSVSVCTQFRWPVIRQSVTDNSGLDSTSRDPLLTDHKQHPRPNEGASDIVSPC